MIGPRFEKLGQPIIRKIAFWVSQFNCRTIGLRTVRSFGAAGLTRFETAGYCAGALRYVKQLTSTQAYNFRHVAYSPFGRRFSRAPTGKSGAASA
jgi:hypothetical protein